VRHDKKAGIFLLDSRYWNSPNSLIGNTFSKMWSFAI